MALYPLMVGRHIMCRTNGSELQLSIIDKTKADTNVAVVVLVWNLRIDVKRRKSKYHDRAILETYAFIIG